MYIGDNTCCMVLISGAKKEKERIDNKNTNKIEINK